MLHSCTRVQDGGRIWKCLCLEIDSLVSYILTQIPAVHCPIHNNKCSSLTATPRG
jgi:hypothetical protein